jgi:hypothetical protein
VRLQLAAGSWWNHVHWIDAKVSGKPFAPEKNYENTNVSEEWL